MSKQDMSPEEEFEAAFQEAAASRRGEETAAPEAEPAPAAEAADAPTEPAAKAAGNEGAPEAPAPEASAEPAQTPEAQLAELRKKVAELEHRERSASNRVSTFHRKLNEAEARAAELQKALNAAKTQAAPSTPAADDPELQAALQEMPELGKLVDRLVAKKVAEAVEPVQKKIQTVEEAGRPVAEFAEREAIRREIAPVDEAVPGWRTIVFNEDGTLTADWSEWLASKSPVIQAAYERVATAQDAIEFLRMYHRDKNIPLPGAPTQQEPQPNETKKKVDLAKAVGIPSRPAARPLSEVPPESDFEANFTYFANQRRRAESRT